MLVENYRSCLFSVDFLSDLLLLRRVVFFLLDFDGGRRSGRQGHHQFFVFEAGSAALAACLRFDVGALLGKASLVQLLVIDVESGRHFVAGLCVAGIYV